ncbi:MAG: hypothetical protein LAO77_09500 [Acidobacteriia bacterium]|nr:hypothetical protein [Terriglobia bacterium]
MFARKARIPIFVLAVIAFGTLFMADTPAATPAPRISWIGPFAVTRMETARFNYTNFGRQPVEIAWAFSNAITGDVLYGDLHKRQRVEAGKGVIWDFDAAIQPDADEYFDTKGRHQLVGWILVYHMNAAAARTAVDLPSIETFTNGIGTTQVVLHANPTAPDDQLVARLTAALLTQAPTDVTGR